MGVSGILGQRLRGRCSTPGGCRRVRSWVIIFLEGRRDLVVLITSGAITFLGPAIIVVTARATSPNLRIFRHIRV